MIAPTTTHQYLPSGKNTIARYVILNFSKMDDASLTFDKAIELLEITDLTRISINDLPQLEKKSKKRWHPDKVSHLNNPVITREYTINFQLIEAACQLIYSYLKGSFRAGDPFTENKKGRYEEPEEIIRKNAPDIQQSIKGIWQAVKKTQYKWTVKEIILSDGFKLKDLMKEDFKEDLAMLSVISFFYGSLFFMIASVIAVIISPVAASIVWILWFIHILACFIGVLPLSRLWLPKFLNTVMIKLVNLGLFFYNWAEQQGRESEKPLLLLFIRLPVLFATIVKYVFLFPVYELTKLMLGNKIVGVVKQKVNYYAGAAEWYIDELINKNPGEMTAEELFHLSFLYSEFNTVKSKN